MEHEEMLLLLGQVAKGNKKAFEHLYAQTSAQMYAVALNMLRQKENAEEATQEAFVRIWYKADHYRQGQGTVLTWMISIVRYRALDMLRHKKVRKEQSLDDDTEMGSHAPDNSNASFYTYEDSVEGQQKLDLCMDELDIQQRQAIHLAYINGLSHSEVVNHLNSPLGTIKSWIRRGLSSLQRCLAL